VLIKDDYECKICGTISRHNEAHHLYSKEHFPKKKYLLKNGVCLCSKCHTGLHRWNGGFKVKCTPKTYENYKRYLLGKEVKKYQKAIIYITILLSILLEISKRYEIIIKI